MSRLLCCLRARRPDMGAALSHPQEGEACDGGTPAAPPTMADVIRERKKKAGGAGLGTLRRRLAAAARRPRDARDARPDRGCEHARFIRSVVSTWSLAEVFLVCEQLEAGAALRDLVTQAELAREPAAALHADLAAALRDRWWCDVELVGAGGWALAAHRALLSARCAYFRQLLAKHSSSTRVPLEGAGAALSREEAAALVWALYAGPSAAACAACAKWERGGSEAELDIISVENPAHGVRGGAAGGAAGGEGCRCGRGAAALRRLAALLGFAADSLQRDMRYLLDSGELCDARLSWRVEGGCGAAYGFRSALELPCHRLVLGARSRFFRSVMSRRGAGGGAGGAVCVDEKVLPRRFARALLHAAYTDQVDLSLIGRSASSPPAAPGAPAAGTARAGAGRASSPTALDDAFQLYEIARFLEMPIVVQGCEDAIVRALAPDTLPPVLRWAAAPHASAWVHRQAMRYLRDEFPAIMAHAASARLPRAALCDALASPFLQASEPAALRALLRYAERAHPQPGEPSVACLSASLGRRGRGRGARGGRRRSAGEGAAREALASLLPLVRLEHLPPDHDLLHQVARRGLVAQPLPSEEVSSADAWLGRGGCRPARCFLPYLDEIKALLEDQAVPEAELARARRARLAARIPDTLYMVAAERLATRDGAGAVGAGAGAGGSAEGAACVSPRTLAALRARVRELRAAPPAASALRRHQPDPAPLHRQIALRAVREMSLPDSCAELLLADPEPDRDCGSAASGRETPRRQDCCSRSSAGSLRGSTSSFRALPSAADLDGSRAGTCRREGARASDPALARAERLSAAVPDVAMAPNANTHLLTARDLYHHHKQAPEYGGAVLQLDLGDGATHTPRPGSRAQRAAAHAARPRELAQERGGQAMSCARARADDELRAAIELSVIRAYSSLGGAARRAPLRPELLPAPLPDFALRRARAPPSPSAPPAGACAARGAVGAAGGAAGAALLAGGAGGSGLGARRRLGSRDCSLGRAGASADGGGASRSGSPTPTPTPAPSPRAPHYRHDLRREALGRGHSPGYA